jgi:hypothetical protein
MKKDSFFNKAPDPNLAMVSQVTNVFMSSGDTPDDDLGNLEQFQTSQVNVGTSTISHFMENAINVAEDGDVSLTGLNEIAGVSFDTIFSPYTTYFSHPTFPKFEIPTNKTEPNSLTLNPFNPNNSLSLYYAPSGSDLWTHSLADTGVATSGELEKLNDPSGWLQYGHGLEFSTVGSGVYDDGPTDYNFQKDFFRRGKVEIEHVRSVGLRAPMVLTGWGFDLDGKPVPADSADSTAFASGAFRDPSNWKSGPLDVRWDDDRKVWAAGGGATKTYLVKTTNVSNPPQFSYEVDRSDSRSQFTRFGPGAGLKTFNKDAVIHDPEYLAYTANADNVGGYEQLNYGGIEYPYYEAFIIRETKDETDSNTYYNIWTDDGNDCGHITNSGCGTQHGGASKDKKILIENPLRQSLEVGDLAFTVKTGRKEKVNTGTFSGGSGAGASGQIVVDQYGVASGEVLSSGSGYSLGAIAIAKCDINIDLSLVFETGPPFGLSAINIGGVKSGFDPGTSGCSLDIISTDAIAQTEELDIHWILQAEFKSQQIVTHVECEGGLLQSCSMKIQTQGFKTCEWCGEDTTFINAF